MTEKKTIGELSAQASRDTNSYCAFDVADEVVKDIEAQVWECISRHKELFDGDFCVVMLIASDPLLKNMVRRKFYAWPFLPKPRTSQTVWYYYSKADEIKGLWCLPSSDALATLSVIIQVDPAYRKMQRWANLFYTTNFWKEIRKESNISMLSEEEHLEVIRKEGTHSLSDDVSPDFTNPIDSMRFDTQQVVDS